jgi:hypothetical protein
MIVCFYFQTGFWIQLGHHLGIALMVGLIFQKVGNDAARPFDNFKFLISVQVFLVYTQVMRNVMLSKSLFFFFSNGGLTFNVIVKI